MADVKNIITLGIGASPGKLMWFITSGLEGAGAGTAFNFTNPRVVFEDPKQAEFEAAKGVQFEDEKTVTIQ